MITINEELRMFQSGNGVRVLHLVDYNDPSVHWYGDSLSQVLTCNSDESAFGGFEQVLTRFRDIEKTRAIPSFFVGSIALIAGLVMHCCNMRGAHNVYLAIGGTLGIASGILRRKAMMFRDSSGNIIDLFLGIVYVGGFNGKMYHFTSSLDAQPSNCCGYENKVE